MFRVLLKAASEQVCQFLYQLAIDFFTFLSDITKGGYRKQQIIQPIRQQFLIFFDHPNIDEGSNIATYKLV